MSHKHVYAIPAYGDSPYLESCIKSLKAQNVTSPVILCTSTPSPFLGAMAEKYDLPYYIREGKSNIRDDWNYAYSMADAEFVTIAHQDDMYCKNYGEELLKAAEKYPDIFLQKETSVLTIDVERTFWEKLTILHKIANFPEGKALPARYARHLYDVYNLGNSWVKESAFKRKELLEKDIAFKQKFYYAKGAHYETATLSSIELLPRKTILNALQEDYQAMKNMIYGNIPEFEEILAFLKELQEEIHRLE